MERLPFAPPLAPMLSKPAGSLPSGDGWQFEPKWDGFRTLVFRDGDEILLQSRDTRPMNRYFPELISPLADALPERCVLDGEIVIAGDSGLAFEALLLRIHPAESRVKLLASQSPASYVAWDLLALGDEDLRAEPLSARRERLEEALGTRNTEQGTGGQAARSKGSDVFLSPATRDRALAEDWFRRFEGAGLDGVMAKRLDEPYRPGERTMIKVKHKRTADCVVAGFRWHKNGTGTRVGSLLLGLYDDAGTLHHVGVTAAFTDATRRNLVEELAPLREKALEGHPWRGWAEAESLSSGVRFQPDTGGGGPAQRLPGASSRWNRGKDLSWEPLRPERVCEVAYDHMQGDRFRHAAQFVRWRPDKRPEDCRYDQLEVTPPYELERVFGDRH
ncbi:MAG TPA: ATP-dependent DNA ligase [Dehalococcoidia bacterium]|nr:ATP-dependent DNA ligase [Dehalococcoidia bacterium]